MLFSSCAMGCSECGVKSRKSGMVKASMPGALHAACAIVWCRLCPVNSVVVCGCSW
jgi:hypothetical protein